MRFKHADARAKGVVKTVSARFDPEQHSNDCQVKKENNVRHGAGGKSDCNNGGACRGGPIWRLVQPVPPHPELPPIAPLKKAQRRELARGWKAQLARKRTLPL